MKKLKIRRAHPEDYKKIANLRKKTFETINAKDYTKKHVKLMNKKNPPKRILEKMKERDMFCLIDKNKILGVIDLEGNKIGGLFVRHSKIKRGYGTLLMNFIENYAKNKGLKKVKLYSTKYAYPFYIKRNYCLVKKGKWKPEGLVFTTYEMEKRLK